MLASQLVTVMDGIRLMTPAPSLGQRSVLTKNLTFVHQVIVASEPLLYSALAVLPPAEHADAFDAQLRTYLHQHAKEESDHADWLAEDLRSAGVDVAQQALSIDAIETVGAQYYLIRHAHPVALLGYMAFLECFPMSLARVEWLEQVHGKELLRTLKHHAEHDPDHGRDLLELIDQVPVGWQALVYNNGVQTAKRFCAASMAFGKGD